MKLKHTGNYSERRASEYPSVGSQLDWLWHAMERGELTRWNLSSLQLKPLKTSIQRSSNQFDYKYLSL